MKGVLLCENLSSVIAGWPIVAEITVEPGLRTLVNFTFAKAVYLFVIEDWAGTSWAPFASKMLLALGDDGDTYGTLDQSGTPDQTLEQKKECILRAVGDIFAYIDQIFRTHPDAVLDYATWYVRKGSRSTNTYAQFIQLITCRCIVDQQLRNSLLEPKEVLFEGVK